MGLFDRLMNTQPGEARIDESYLNTGDEPIQQAILEIAPEFIVNMGFAGEHHFKVVEHELPGDAEIMRYGIKDNVFRVILYSDTFRPIEPGEPLPVLHAPRMVKL